MKIFIALVFLIGVFANAGILPASRGGTGAALIPAAGGVISSTSSGFNVVPAGTQNQILISNGASNPSFTGNITLAAGTTIAGGAPLVIPAGSSLAAPISGAFESNGAAIFWTDSTGKRWRIQLLTQ